MWCLGGFLFVLAAMAWPPSVSAQAVEEGVIPEPKLEEPMPSPALLAHRAQEKRRIARY